MNMLIEELQRLAADPRSWAVVALMAIVAAHSLVILLRCPYVHGTIDFDDGQVEQARNTPFTPGLRFGAMMVLGIALTLTGLCMISKGLQPTLSLAAMAGGLLIVQTEPARLRIRENKTRVIAHRDAEPAVLGNERNRLRLSHQELTMMNVVVLMALTAALFVF